MKFLTSNTSLDGNKRNIFVGIYFSNRLLDSSKCLIALDKFLKCNIDKINDTQFKKELTKIFIGRTDNSKEHLRSFVNGFDKKNFIKWKLNDLKEIVKIWYIYDTKTQTN